MKEDQGRYFFLYFRGFGELHYCRLYPLFDLFHDLKYLADVKSIYLQISDQNKGGYSPKKFPMTLNRLGTFLGNIHLPS